MRYLLSRFRSDETGTTVIEVAILLPALLAMLIGVMQVGWYLQAQNAVRGVAGEMSRFITVESQKSNSLSDDQIRAKAITVAVSPPYMLISDGFDVEVNDSATQDLNRVRRVDLEFIYDVPSVLGFNGVDMLTLRYTRSVFIPK